MLATKTMMACVAALAFSLAPFTSAHAAEGGRHKAKAHPHKHAQHRKHAKKHHRHHHKKHA